MAASSGAHADSYRLGNRPHAEAEDAGDSEQRQPFLGPTLYDRILAVNNFGTKTVLLIAVMDFLGGRPDFLDIAIVYALINFISIIGVLRFFEYAEKKTAEHNG